MPDVKYGDYIASQEYRDYYARYFTQIRESDRVLIEMVHNRLDERLQHGDSLSLIDIGCGSGQLLFHLKHQLPQITLTGADAFPAVVEQCRQNQDLSGITFVDADLLNPRIAGKTVPALLWRLRVRAAWSSSETRGVRCIARATRRRQWVTERRHAALPETAS